ncbi:MAG: hypothetical protein F7B95_01660 [Desulfurococcales archaeon]|nr:hypothetical protein [Desulfurococcales archaeon]
MELQELVLVTGFSYYGVYPYNPSGDLAEKLDGTVVEGFKVIGRVLPVSFRRALGILDELLKEYRPAVAVGLGLHPRATAVLLELAGVNLAHFERPDVNGFRARLEAIDDGGPQVLYTGLPVDRVHSACNEGLQLRIRPSVTIGTYLCNAVGYKIMRYGSLSGAVAGFLHVPPTTDMALKLGLNNYVAA